MDTEIGGLPGRYARIGAELRLRRMAMGLTQSEAAMIMHGRTPYRLSLVERGINVIPIKDLNDYIFFFRMKRAFLAQVVETYYPDISDRLILMYSSKNFTYKTFDDQRWRDWAYSTDDASQANTEGVGPLGVTISDLKDVVRALVSVCFRSQQTLESFHRGNGPIKQEDMMRINKEAVDGLYTVLSYLETTPAVMDRLLQIQRGLDWDEPHVQEGLKFWVMPP